MMAFSNENDCYSCVAVTVMAVCNVDVSGGGAFVMEYVGVTDASNVARGGPARLNRRCSRGAPVRGKVAIVGALLASSPASWPASLPDSSPFLSSFCLPIP
ncbi:hypothetical protein [Burkholderia sp. 22PA0106]|uniref:hypothetical protein n=1 Tax=Burkholderia sp. 22PA0106 TaxID=3237371 RepID=UPI0039C1FBEC